MKALLQFSVFAPSEDIMFLLPCCFFSNHITFIFVLFKTDLSHYKPLEYY